MTVLERLVPIEFVQAEMAGRQPQLLEEGGKHRTVYEHLLRQRAVEVTAICGDPPPKDVVDLAVTCVVLGTAMALESSLFPAQLNQDNARGQQLRDRYVAVLADLRRKVSDGDAFTISTLPPAPPNPYPWGEWV